jgi:hypothetical protein
MPKDHIPATSNSVPGPVRDEDDIAEELDEREIEDAPEEEGGLGPRG